MTLHLFSLEAQFSEAKDLQGSEWLTTGLNLFHDSRPAGSVLQGRHYRLLTTVNVFINACSPETSGRRLPKDTGVFRANSRL